MNLDEAKKACHRGGIAAFISCGITLLVVLIAMVDNSTDDRLAYFNDPALFADAVILFLVGVGMMRCSRAAAVSALVYWLMASIVKVVDFQSSSVLLSLLFLYFFAKAVQGSFAYHRLRKAEDPAYIAAPKWQAWVGIPVLLLLFSFMGFGLWLTATGTPPTAVVSGDKISEANQQLLMEHEVLVEDEVVEYFYSWGMTSVLEGGSILSNFGITSYYQEENGEMVVHWLAFEDIYTIELMEVGNFLNDSVYRVVGFEDDVWFDLLLSTEANGDVMFIETSRRMINSVPGQQSPDQLETLTT